MNDQEFQKKMKPILFGVCGWLKNNGTLTNEWKRITRHMDCEEAKKSFGAFWRRRDWPAFEPRPAQFDQWLKEGAMVQPQKTNDHAKFGDEGLVVKCWREQKYRFGWVGQKGRSIALWWPVPEKARWVFGKKWTLASIRPGNPRNWTIEILGCPAPDNWRTEKDKHGWPISLARLYKEHGWMDRLREEMAVTNG